jgi:hypothetical protein
MAAYSATAEGIIVNVAAKPRSSRAGVDGVAGDALRVRVRAAPVDGKANAELQKTLADAFGIPKSRVEIKSGESSKTKRVLLRGLSDDAAFRELFGRIAREKESK